MSEQERPEGIEEETPTETASGEDGPGGENKPTIAELEDAIDSGETRLPTPEGVGILGGDPVRQTFASTDDSRTMNNVMRHNYRALTETEKRQMQALKDLGLEFIELLHSIGGTDAPPITEHTRQASRYLSVAQTKVEEAVMWAVKEVTE